MDVLILMAIFAGGLFLNFASIHTLGSLATGDWSEYKQAMIFIVCISALCSLGILLG